MAADYYDLLEVPPRRQRRRHQARVPAPGPSAPPGHERRPRGRGAVQGGRRSPTRCCPTPTSASATTASAPDGRGGRRPASPAAASTTSSTPSSAATARSEAAAGAAPRARRAAPTSRWWPTSPSRRRCSARATRSTCAPRSPCEPCGATGAKPGTEPITCLECAGVGQVQRVRQSFLGQMVTNSICPRCNGQGQVISDPCATCGGEGRTVEERTYTVDIPAGVDTGSTLRLTGRGAVGPARRAARRPLRARAGRSRTTGSPARASTSTATCRCRFAQAALGAHIEFATLDGEEDLVVPRGTPSGKEFRLKGRGVPHLERRHRGDLIVRVLRRRAHRPHPRARRSCCGSSPSSAATRSRPPTPASCRASAPPSAEPRTAGHPADHPGPFALVDDLEAPVLLAGRRPPPRARAAAARRRPARARATVAAAGDRRGFGPHAVEPRGAIERAEPPMPRDRRGVRAREGRASRSWSCRS